MDKIKTTNKLYLTNSFNKSVLEIIDIIKNNEYDFIICFGQAPLKNNTLKIETIGKNETQNYKTKYDYSLLKNELDKNNYKVIISTDAGYYLCNNVYYNTLKYIENNSLKSQVIFLHISNLLNTDNVVKLASVFNNYNDKI